MRISTSQSKVIGMRFMSLPLVAGALVLSGCLIGAAGDAQAGYTKYSQCSGSNFRIRFSAVYTEEIQGKQTVKQLDVELELDRASDFKKGQKVTFFLDGKKLKSMGLSVDRNGDLEADLKLNSKTDKDFPKVENKAKISAEIRGDTIDSCRL